jgi:methyltransferase-like protein/2-polyprenyl-3-methyl-5-hydroxy-6-metoxy-1,4-benzoquinol methylase
MTEAVNITNQNSYDETPYDSYPYYQTTPEKLATLGELFGMDTPKIETARVLELGCAAGGNLIPHAVHYPKGKYVGVDLSKVQIEEGQAHIKALGLNNIELKHCSITDIDESFGKFDYIICHGVLSWVPEAVQEKIFETVSKNLSPNGIAYISYNTLPGWNMVRTIRDMMLYHVRGFASPQEKVSQARALLGFVKEGLEGTDTPYAKMLAQEFSLLSKQGDHYIRHEHLEEDNKQFYLTEFMEKAAKNGMQYLSDVALSTMYLGNMKPEVAEKLKNLNDIVKTEQYMDFINNRRFRSTLLCHGNIKLNRSLSNDSVKKFSMSIDITPEQPLSEIKLEDEKQLKFFFRGDKNNHIATSSPWLKSILYVLAENKGYPLKFDSIVSKADKLFNNDCQQHIKAELHNNAMNLVIKGYMEISMFEKDKDKIHLEKPVLNNLALYQINHTKNNWVTSSNHSVVSINIFDKFALKYMDGKNTKNQIVSHLIQEVKSDRLTISKDNKKIEDSKQIKQELVACLDQTIERLSSQGVFE